MKTQLDPSMVLDLEQVKTCRKCRATKTLDMFPKDSVSLDGRHRLCRECANSMTKARQAAILSGNKDRTVDPNYRKVCGECGIEQSAENYYANKRGLDSLFRVCKSCNDLLSKRRISSLAIRLVEFAPNLPVTKVCSKCKLERNALDFSRDSRSLNGLHYICRICQSLYRSSRIVTLEEHFKRNIDTSKRKFKRQIEHSITVDDLLALWKQQNGRCVYTGVSLTHKQSSRTEEAHWTNVSVDRIDSDRGYVLGNVQLVCLWANVAKSHMPDEMFRKFLGLAATHLTGNGNG